MKIVKVLYFLFLVGCSEQGEHPTLVKVDKSEVSERNKISEWKWTGVINNKIPVFLHYSLHDQLLVGQLTYLNTKDRKPINVIGTIEDDKSHRLLEFEKDGNITGIITGNPEGEQFIGSWFSPKTRVKYSLSLSKKDTTVNAPDLAVNANDMYGSYYYQYSKDGQQGGLEFSKVSGHKAAFEIFSVTDAPGRNIAEIPLDTISINGNSFIYELPGAEPCAFRVTFYKGFATVAYTKGFCEGFFGWNATVDGIYLKVKR